MGTADGRPDDRVPGVDGRPWWGDHHGPRPLAHGAAADCCAAQPAEPEPERRLLVTGPEAGADLHDRVGHGRDFIALLQPQGNLEPARVLELVLHGITPFDLAFARLVGIAVGLRR